MAVSKSFFLRRKGVVGSLQMARMNGQQITKDKSSFVHDAKTRAQLVQRMCMATATAFYKEGKEILSWSVEGARNTNEAMHFLYNKNVAILRDLAHQEKGLFKLKGNDYMLTAREYISPLYVSYGSLPSVSYQRVTFYVCNLKKWQAKKGDTLIICGWRQPNENENGRQFTWYKLEFIDNPSANFFENVNIPIARERMKQFCVVSFSTNSTINANNYIVQATTEGRLRLSVAGMSSWYAVIRMRKENGVLKFSTSNIVDVQREGTNFTEALATYGVPRDEILNGE